MKVQKIVEQTNEFNRLYDLIKSIEQNLKDIDHIEKGKIEENGYTYVTIGGSLSISGWNTQETKERTINVNITENVSKLIRPQIKTILQELRLRL